MDPQPESGFALKATRRPPGTWEYGSHETTVPSPFSSPSLPFQFSPRFVASRRDGASDQMLLNGNGLAESDSGPPGEFDLGATWAG